MGRSIFAGAIFGLMLPIDFSKRARNLSRVKNDLKPWLNSTKKKVSNI